MPLSLETMSQVSGGVSKVLQAVPEMGRARKDWDLLGCVEIESLAGPRGIKPSADKRAGLEVWVRMGLTFENACFEVL